MALPIHAARRRATIGARVDGVNGLTPALYYVQVDHLNRPIRLTNAAKAAVWTAVWKPFGEPQSITGAASLDARFPGQWFQLESGLSYNWHRQYDASTGRYAEPDPLGFVDGPGVYGFALAKPIESIDRSGLEVPETVKEYCRVLRGEIFWKAGKLFSEIAKYSPIGDGMGGYPMSGGGVTKPGGHYKEILDLQRGLKSDLREYQKNCRRGRGPDDTDSWCPITPRSFDEMASRPNLVPPPIYPKPDEDGCSCSIFPILQ